MAGDPDVQSVIDARLVARSSTAFTAADIANALHERGFRRSQGDVAAVLDAMARVADRRGSDT